jgi:hypothetical protein
MIWALKSAMSLAIDDPSCSASTCVLFACQV